MTSHWRTAVWKAATRTGFDRICSALAEGRLQVMCYHGFSFVDEHLFRPKLFMTPGLFEKRLEWLRKNRYAVLSLDEAVQRLRTRSVGRREIAITIDDGFHSVYALAAPLLRAYGMKATVYVATYYVAHRNPVFRLAIQYMAWKSRENRIVPFKPLSLDGQPLVLHGHEAEEPLERFYETAEARCTEAERTAIAREFGRRTGVDYDELLRSRRLSLMSEAELSELHSEGFSIQLHTHRHRLPLDAPGIVREIDDNRRFLSRVTDEPLRHLCYPSGEWDMRHWQTLQRLGIASATTCIAGFNSPRTPLLALRRFLDSEIVSVEEFGAEMAGAKDLYRRMRSGVSGARRCGDRAGSRRERQPSMLTLESHGPRGSHIVRDVHLVEIRPFREKAVHAVCRANGRSLTSSEAALNSSIAKSSPANRWLSMSPTSSKYIGVCQSMLLRGWVKMRRAPDVDE